VKPIVDSPTIADFQRYVAEMEVERGFADQSVRDKCLLLGEEVGELFKSVRKFERLSIDENSDVGTVADELADVLIYLCAIANRCGVELEQAFRGKERKNSGRQWTRP